MKIYYNIKARFIALFFGSYCEAIFLKFSFTFEHERDARASVGETFLDADDLMQALYKDESWFKKVFKK